MPPAPLRRVCATIGCVLACGEPRPSPPVTRTIAEPIAVLDAGAPEPVPTAAPTIDVLARWPALAFHPGVTRRLHDALANAAPARERLLALAQSLAPFRWESATSWDNTGFVATDGDALGFVTRRGGEVVAQAPGSFDLGCAGGFLEGVRLTLLPTLAMHELAACDAQLSTRVSGAPDRCEPRDFGLRAIANVADRLDATRLPDGPRIVELGPDDALRLAQLRAPGAAHLCAVSHTALAHGGQRFYHHMMIVLGTEDGETYDVFDTTGSRGVAVQRMRQSRFVTYVGGLLAANRDYRYAAASTRLGCVRVVLTTE